MTTSENMKEVIAPVINEKDLPVDLQGNVAGWVVTLPKGLEKLPMHSIDNDICLMYQHKVEVMEIPDMTLFLSNREIQNIKNFYNEMGHDPSHIFDFDGAQYCGRTYVKLIGKHSTIIFEEDGIRIVGLGNFYIEDEEF